jgi:flagellar basal body-associated protein FliL
MTPAPKKSRSGLIIAIILIVLCCCCVVVAGGGYWLWNNGDRLLGTGAIIINSLASL